MSTNSYNLPVSGVQSQESAMLSKRAGGLLQGQAFLITGITNERSYASSIVRSVWREGAIPVLAYQADRLRRGAEKLADSLPGAHLVQMDVEQPSEMSDVCNYIKMHIGSLNGIVHSIAFAPRVTFGQPLLEVSQEDMIRTLTISALSLPELIKAFLPVLSPQAKIVAMTYIAGEGVVPGYDTMGLAKTLLERLVWQLAYELGRTYGFIVNAISAGPADTVASRSIPGFLKMKRITREAVPLQRDTDPSAVGDTAAFLLSHWARDITGEVVHVDCGYHILRMTSPLDPSS